MMSCKIFKSTNAITKAKRKATIVVRISISNHFFTKISAVGVNEMARKILIIKAAFPTHESIKPLAVQIIRLAAKIIIKIISKIDKATIFSKLYNSSKFAKI